MNKLLSVLAIGAMVFMVSCDKDEPKVDPIVGLWELDDATISGAPTDYSLLNGTGNSLYAGEESYSIEFFSDGFYEREIAFSDGQNIEEEGFWEIVGDELQLDPDDESGLIESFTIEEEASQRSLVLSGERTFETWPDSIIINVLPTITTAEQFDSLVLAFPFVSIPVDVELDFDRRN